jgi:hypothetical protein
MIDSFASFVHNAVTLYHQIIRRRR